MLTQVTIVATWCGMCGPTAPGEPLLLAEDASRTFSHACSRHGTDDLTPEELADSVRRTLEMHPGQVNQHQDVTLVWYAVTGEPWDRACPPGCIDSARRAVVRY